MSWYDMVSTEEDRLLDLSLEDWTAERINLMKTRPAFATRIDHLRRDLYYARKDRRTPTPDMPQMRYYRDVADEPWKYGDDAFEQWLLLDNDLPKFPGRWRVDAYWTRREEDEILAPQRVRFFDLLTRAQSEFTAKVAAATKIQALVRGQMVRTRLNAAATKIQALIRGHQLRCSVRFMDCAECLGHGVAPHIVEGRHICRTCYDTLGWTECGFCGMPVHRDRQTEFYGCCSRECMMEIFDPTADPPDQTAACEGCGCDMDVEDKNEYRRGYWCSRACAYD
jgi:hypothetical protein